MEVQSNEASLAAGDALSTAVSAGGQDSSDTLPVRTAGDDVAVRGMGANKRDIGPKGQLERAEMEGG